MYIKTRIYNFKKYEISKILEIIDLFDGVDNHQCLKIQCNVNWQEQLALL